MKYLILLILTAALASKPSSAQDLLWAKQYSGMDMNSSVDGGQLQVDANGHLYLMNSFNGTADFDPGTGIITMTGGAGSDHYLLKADSDGSYIWAKQFSSPPGSNIQPISFAVDDSGNSYISGTFNGTIDFDPNAGVESLTSIMNSPDAFILKLDSSGNFLWVKQVGGYNSQAGGKILIDNNNTLYITGNFKETADFDPGPGTNNLTSAGLADIFVLKLDASGNFISVTQYGDSGNDLPIDLGVDASGNGYLTSTESSINYISKFNSSGNILWHHQLPSSLGASLTVSGNDIFISGQFANTYDFDQGPGTYTLTSFGSADGYILKLDNTGNFVWAKQIGGTGIEDIRHVIVDGNGGLSFPAYSDGTCDFDPGPFQYNLTATQGNNENDIFVVSLTSSGELNSVKQFGNAKWESVSGLIFDSQNNIIVSGSFHDTIDFDPGPGVHELSTGTFDLGAFLIKLSAATNVPGLPTAKNAVQIFPNPTNGTFTISSDKLIRQINIHDAIGKKVYSLEVNNYLNVLNLDLATGIYYITVINDSSVVTEKMLFN